jgi:hypothetical protein
VSGGAGGSTAGALSMGVCSSLCGPSSYEPIDNHGAPPRPPPSGQDMRRGLGTYDSGSDSDDPEVSDRRWQTSITMLVSVCDPFEFA